MGFEVPNWQEHALGDVVKFQAGSAFKPEEQGHRCGEIPFIKVSDLNLPNNTHSIIEANNWLSRKRAEELKIKIHKAGATVFAKIGVALTYNRRRLLSRDTAIDNNLMSAVPDENRILPLYLYFLLKCMDFNRIAKGSALPYINISDLKKLKFSLPSRAQQKEIVEILSSIEDRIDLLRQTNTTLEAIAQALFKSWFVDFDPVHVKTEGCDPEAMDVATAALFPSEFEQSELGSIPKGWRAGTLDDLSHLNAKNWSSKRHPDAVIYVDLSGVHENRIGAVKELPYSDTPSRARRSLRDGDTIVGTVRPGNRAFAYIHHPAANLTGSTGFAVLSPKEEALAPFVYLAATRDDSIERLANLADGGAYPAVRPNVVSATPVVIPPASIITAFSRITAPMLHKIGESRDAEATLVELRDTLLPRLISGKLRLPDAVEATEGALV